MPFELIPPGTSFDFIGRRHLCITLSLLLFAAGLAAIPVQGFRLGIDFAGGTELQVRFDPGATVDEGAIRELAGACGVGDPAVIRYGDRDSSDYLLRFTRATEAGADGACPITPEQQAALVRAAEGAGLEAGSADTGELVDRVTYALGNRIGPLEVMRVEYVGPRVGGELRRDGLYALGLACVFILIYIAFRFSARFAPGAIVALVHDIGITAGLFVIFGLEFDLRVLAALLAIMGYSLNDTIIIYDRIRENMELRTKHDLTDVLNRSVNQTLSRTVLTSGTTMAAVLTLLLLGGEAVRPFAIAMAIGVVVGTYSSIFIAAPVLLFLETRFGSEQAAAR